MVLRKRKYDSATAMLKELHWLPVQARIDYKLSVLCFGALNKSLPSYFNCLVAPHVPARVLRSNDNVTLTVPRTKTKTFGDRAFTAAGPAVWNSLPLELKNQTSILDFRRDLKTHLFQLNFD